MFIVLENCVFLISRHFIINANIGRIVFKEFVFLNREEKVFKAPTQLSITKTKVY